MVRKLSINMKNYEKSNYFHFHSDENPFLDENICDESENNDYDSDCSLGSMNSLYLNLKKIPKCNNESERVNQKYFYNNNLSKASLSSEKIDLKIYVSKEKRFYDKIKDNNLAKKLNTSRFYGQRVIINHEFMYIKQNLIYTSIQKM